MSLSDYNIAIKLIFRYFSSPKSQWYYIVFFLTVLPHIWTSNMLLFRLGFWNLGRWLNKLTYVEYIVSVPWKNIYYKIQVLKTEITFKGTEQVTGERLNVPSQRPQTSWRFQGVLEQGTNDPFLRRVHLFLKHLPDETKRTNSLLSS